MDAVAKILIGLGLILIFSGLVWYLTDGKIPLGRLPGDIRIKTETTQVFIPITTCLLISGVLSLLAYLFRKF